MACQLLTSDSRPHALYVSTKLSAVKVLIVKRYSSGSMLEDPAMFTLRKSAPGLLERLLNGFSQPPVELVYTSQPNWPFGSILSREFNANRPLRLSVLDSSFNPPTRAHLALANARRPHAEQLKDDRPGLQEGNDYDAKLLLLSVKNADKKLKPGDATYLQRLEMMALLTKHMSPASTAVTAGGAPSFAATANVAIAITDEPTFVGKSEVLLAFLRQKLLSLPASPTAIELTFLIGQDTLERLFSSRYYSSDTVMTKALHKFFTPAPEGDNSRLVSATRALMPGTSSDEHTTANSKASHLVQHYLSLGRLTIIDIGEEESTYSSSAVRNAIALEGCAPKDPEARQTWRNFVTTEVADYIIQEKLFTNKSMTTNTGFLASQS